MTQETGDEDEDEDGGGGDEEKKKKKNNNYRHSSDDWKYDTFYDHSHRPIGDYWSSTLDLFWSVSDRQRRPKCIKKHHFIKSFGTF